ncbi:MAG: hypothetical protein ACK4KV_19610 [Rhodocyclaceae bacterium]
MKRRMSNVPATVVGLGLALVLAATLGGCGGSGGGSGVGPRPGPEAGVPDAPAKVLALDALVVPHELRHIALELFEEIRRVPGDAPLWQSDAASVAPSAVAMYRPDVDGPAYYEFSVMGGEGAPAGFIIVSAGKHDFPIAHWDTSGASVSADLAHLAAETGEKIAAIYKLDSLYYVAENERGEQVAELGTRLVRLSNFPADMLTRDAADFGAAAHSSPALDAPDTQLPADVAHFVKVEGMEDAGIVFAEWASWSELKSDYRETYAPLIEDLRQDAAEAWSVRAELTEQGEGLGYGERRVLASLQAVSGYRVLGEGAQWVTVSPLKDGMALEIEVTVPVYERRDVAVEIDYANGEKVLHRYFLLTMEENIRQPLVVTEGVARHPARPGPWSDYSTFSAVGWPDAQPMYRQFRWTFCQVGCGPVAWAMLFNWADHQAHHGNPYWAGRCNLFGDCATAAPLTQEREVSNQISTLHNLLGTFCVPGGAGATTPWAMGRRASRWLEGRATGTRVVANWNSVGRRTNDLRDAARSEIRLNGTPAIIGTGWLTHYPLAYRYQGRHRHLSRGRVEYDRHFYVNQGWAGSRRNEGWVAASTWFAGRIRPR